MTRERDPDCLFCRIASGDLPATMLHEDDLVMAFRDIAPRAPTHLLVIPRRHVASATDAAGNGGTGATTFTVTVTPGALKGLLDDFATGSSVPPSLKQKIDALFNGDVTQAKLNALRNEIRAQAGKKITTEGAQILLDILATLG